MSLASGVRLGPYEIERQIGAGGMGEVYRARDTRLGRDVAVKVLPPEVAGHPDCLRRFEREARAVAALNHPNILALFDIGTHEGAPFIVTELLEGESLQQRLKGGDLTVRRVVEIAVEIARGLAAAHEQGIVHRDIKPANVFLAKDGRIKILDFGIAKLVTERGANGLGESPTVAEMTEIGTALGTVGYAAPEQLRGQVVDQRADVFSFGCVLYEMVSGRSPFLKATGADTAAAILREDPPPLAVRGQEMPVSLGAIVNRCLEKRPDDRFSSAHDLALALQAVAEALLTGQPAVDSPVKSIVVLPFENLSPDPDNAYFADGLTEEIIADLSKIRALRVISRTSAMHYKGTAKPLPAIARELNVRHVLEGSVRRAGNNLRITAQLIDAATDAHLWAEKYTGTLDDVFDMQEKVSRAIVEGLTLELTPQEQQRLAARRVPDGRAFERYLRAKQELYSMMPASLDRAGELTREAIAIVGPNALLYATLGHISFWLHDTGVRTDDATLQEAAAWSDRALELSPDCGLAFVVKSQLARKRGEMGAAIRLMRRAVELGAGGEALSWLSYSCFQAGRLDECRDAAERAMVADPLTGQFAGAHAALADGDLQLGLLRMRAVADAHGGVSAGNVFLAFALLYAGQDDEAVRTLSQLAHSGAGVWDDFAAVLSAMIRRDRDATDRILARKPAFLFLARADKELSWWLTDGFAYLGDHDAALEWLGSAIDCGFCNHRFWSTVDPVLAPLRGDPRFEALMDRAHQKERAFEAER